MRPACEMRPGRQRQAQAVMAVIGSALAEPRTHRCQNSLQVICNPIVTSQAILPFYPSARTQTRGSMRPQGLDHGPHLESLRHVMRTIWTPCAKPIAATVTDQPVILRRLAREQPADETLAKRPG